MLTKVVVGVQISWEEIIGEEQLLNLQTQLG